MKNIKVKVNNAKLASEIGAIICNVLVGVFAVLILTVVLLTQNSITKSMDGEFNAISSGSASNVQAILKAAETTAIDMSSYLEKAYKMRAEGKRNMAGEPMSENVVYNNYKSTVCGIAISELSADMEKYLIETARNTAVGNTDIVGFGILFEPNKFDKNVRDYGFYINEDSGDKAVELYGDYETYSKEIFYKTAKESKKPIFTEPYDYDGDVVVSYCVPILNNDEVQGVIMADIKVSNFEKIVNSHTGYSSLFYTVYNDKNILVYDSKDSKAVKMKMEDLVTNKAEQENIISGIETGKEFTVQGKIDRVGYTRYFSPVTTDAGNWWAITSIKTSEKNSSIILTIVLTILISIISLVVIIAAFVIVLKKRLKPIESVVIAAENIAVGKFDIEKKTDSNNEIGQLSNTFNRTGKQLETIIGDVNRLLSEMADGNFAVLTAAEDAYVGEFNGLLLSIRKLNRQLNGTLKQINTASSQVSLGSTQMADSAQSLAEGATDQAGAVEELQATITNVVEQVSENTKQSKRANIKTIDVKREAEVSNKEMGDMTVAMKRISETSLQIQNIIEEIEDIASQTNLLSLNAAIEAARAGEAGKGFAVVADQIRKLAADSAQSAVNTRQLIETSIKEVENGSEITERTSSALGKVIGGMNEIAEIVGITSTLSEQQLEAIQQIEQGVEQISGVIQNNSAAAEETSATSEELLAQAISLNELVGQFKLRDYND